MSDADKISAVDSLKAELDAFRPLPPDVLESLRSYYRIGLTYSSNALEGNSLTETETRVALEDGITIGGKPLRDYFEAVGHAQAYDWLYVRLGNGVRDNAKEALHLTEEDILTLHRLFYRLIQPEWAGVYRKKPVIITGSAFVPPRPSEVPTQMSRFVDALAPEWLATLHPVGAAARLHLELARIHPFVDGNGRTARLLMNLALLHGGYGVTTIPPILRRDYLNALEAANAGESPDSRPFIHFISQVVYESMKDALRLVRALSAS